MKNKKELIKRSYEFEVRAEQEGEEGKEQRDVIEGRAIVYGSMTDMGFMNEIIEPGALDGADLTDVRFLVNHDLSRIPLARSRQNNKNSTLQLTTDEKGLAVKVYMDTKNNSDARSLYSAVQRGDISGMSFMFSIDDDEWEDLESEKPTHRIKKISSVIEVSAVTFPAYEDTEIYTRDKSALERARRTLESEKDRASALERADETRCAAKIIMMMYGGKTC